MQLSELAVVERTVLLMLRDDSKGHLNPDSFDGDGIMALSWSARSGKSGYG